MVTRSVRVVMLWTVLLAAASTCLATGSDVRKTVVADPHYGEVLYYFYQEDYFPAIVRLLAGREQQKLAHHDAEAELLLGGLYLSYGQHQHAAKIFERLLANNADASIRDRTWFFLARIWYQRGYKDEAQRALASIGQPLPDAMEPERQNLMAQILIDKGEYAHAIELLSGFRNRTEWASYARYNLGVALARSGQVGAATEILDGLGRVDAYNDELRALRDKANLALGYTYLQDGQPLAAKAPLQRVRLNGPFSNKALLGVGWADAEVEDYRGALVPWMELQRRSLLDPAVQESRLAIPFAMAKLDSTSQAADFYLNAIDAFREEAVRIDRAIDAVEHGSLLRDFLADDSQSSAGWQWRLEDLPEGEESHYLYSLLATNRFQEGLKNYRDLDYLARNLERWQDNVAVYRNMLGTRELAYDVRLPKVRDSLARADLEAMVDNKLDFDARLARIEQKHDTLALATPEEFAMWGEIASLESTPALRADIPLADDARRKIRLMKGVLIWQLDREFRERAWTIRHNLHKTGEALVAAQRSRRQIDQSMQTEPQKFAGFDTRIERLSPRITDLQDRVDRARSRQHSYLQGIAIGEMQAQRERLETYTVQARFALASIYDRSSSSGGAAQ